MVQMFYWNRQLSKGDVYAVAVYIGWLHIDKQ